MIRAARKEDLSLTELAAYNHSRQASRWDLPFALFQSRLAAGVSVLDVSPQPEDLRDRLLGLYPTVSYRHRPVWEDRLQLPADGPGEAFDRVASERVDRILCVDTLDRLRPPSRQALIAELSRRLEPGGLLVFTCGRPRTAAADPGERVTVRELVDRCAAHGLQPLEADAAAGGLDAAADSEFGAVFTRATGPRLPAGSKIALGMLTWNTRDVSLESLSAYVREAQMLARLGQEPSILVYDNGSTDGTREALQAVDEGIEIPHRFFLGERNRGSSIARNVMIDAALAAAADYLLFLDGDIEIVPFSSFSMLRHLEDGAPEVGCLGAFSNGQTPRREEASACLFGLAGCRVTDDRDKIWTAWTQYGLFRAEVFAAGVRFEEHEPFDRPGWGCEDVDLAFQMHGKGFYNQDFTGMVYLHRNVNSSIPELRRLGADPAAGYERRRRYVIEKWQGRSLGEATIEFLRGAAADPRF